MGEVVEISDEKSYRDIIKQTIENEILGGLDENQLKEVQNSQHVRLARSLLEKAAEYAKEQNITVDDFEWDVVSPATEFLSTLSYGLARYDEEDVKKKFNYWHHNRNPALLIKNEETPYMDRSEIEAAVGEYLKLPFRDEKLDRLLVDVLIALELYGYGNEVYNSKGIPGLIPSPYAYLKINPLWHFIKGQFFNAIFFFGLAAAFVFASTKDWMSDDWAIGIAALLVIAFFVFLIWGLISLPRFWISISKAKEKTHGLMDAMIGLYTEMNSDGPISAKHIREGAQKTADKGVVWPGPLFALLDNIIERTGRF